MQRSAVEIYDHGLPLALTFRGVLQVNVKLLCRPEVVLTSLHILPECGCENLEPDLGS